MPDHFPSTVEGLFIHCNHLTKEQLQFLLSYYRHNIQANWYQFGFVAGHLMPRMRMGEWLEFMGLLRIGTGTWKWLIPTAQKFYRLRLVPPRDIHWRTLVTIAPYLTLTNAESLYAYCRTHKPQEVQFAAWSGELREL